MPMASRTSLARKAFTHEPLKDGEIRLLELLPRDTYGYLRFAMRTFVRTDAPRYAALSYVWGPESKRIIFVGDAVFYVRENLSDALESIVRRFEDISADERVFERSELAFETRKFIWVDAICIDQNKVDERNTQVSLMKRTYTEAATVMVWLGTEEGEAQGFEDLRSWKWRDHVWQLANRTYWSRIWVVQEFLVACDIIIVCGNHWILERDFFGEVGRLQPPGIANNFSNMTTFAKDANDSEAHSLDHMLGLYHDNNCSDPRDRVFALLGCIGEQEQEALSSHLPNYELSYDEVAIIALAHIMRFSGKVPLLNHVLFRGTRLDFADKMRKIAFAFEVLRCLPWSGREKTLTEFVSSLPGELHDLQKDRMSLEMPGPTGLQEEPLYVDASHLDQLADRYASFRQYVHARDYLVEDDPSKCAKLLFYFRAGRWFPQNVSETAWSG